VVSGELSGELVVGRADPAATDWRRVVGTRRTGPAETRSPRNYPGDVKLSTDGRLAYFANRGYDTVSVIAVHSEQPEIVAELAAAPWPQHLLVREGELLVACWDGSVVLRALTDRGVPAELEFAFAVPGAGWLLEI
jgi:6-phosphogluconolactonase